MLIYGAIALFGVIVLLSMLLVGELFGGDHELSHEMVAGHDVDHGGGPSIFSTRIMAGFLTAFGVGGVVGRYYHFSPPAAAGIGAGVGVRISSVVFSVA